MGKSTTTSQTAGHAGHRLPVGGDRTRIVVWLHHNQARTEDHQKSIEMLFGHNIFFA